MDVMAPPYTTRLQAGLGMLEETRTLLDLWQPDLTTPALYQRALRSGRFPTMSARRLRNLVVEGFAPRYLEGDAMPARRLASLRDVLASRELEQLFFLYTCRANPILRDFVLEVYWRAYAAGQHTLATDNARAFVARANQDGRTARPWSDITLRRVAGYLTGCLADFGLLERGAKPVRRILPFRLEARIAAILAYDLHFAGHGDNRVVVDPDWALFGLEVPDVLETLRRLSLKGLVIVQAAGGVTRIGWQCGSWEELTHVLAQGELR